MNVIPLFKEVNRTKDDINDLEVILPSAWWISSYSLDFNDKICSSSNKPTYKFSQVKKEVLPITDGWTIKNGDYRVMESLANSHDYVYYRDLKIKLVKYSIYPVVILTMLLVFTLSEFLSKYIYNFEY